MSHAEITPAEKRGLQILQHSLGLNPHGQGASYRNHYVAGGQDLDDCLALTAAGLMTQGRKSDLSGGSPLFSVTRAGKAWVSANSPPPPELSEGRRRYRAWLESGTPDGDVPFGDWLKEQTKASAHTRERGG